MARILLESARRHCKSADLFLCLADRAIEWHGLHGDHDGFEVVEAEDLRIPDFPGFAFRYDLLEINTAVKPFMFLHLMEGRGYERVLYFDPDIEIHGPLDEVLRPLQDGASMTLTPHLLRPQESKIGPNDLSVMRAGVYNLGFLGTSKTTESLDALHWWARRLTYECVNDQASGLFVDQKFMDLIPGFLSNLAILRRPGLNVAYWNLPQRTLLLQDGVYTVDDEPLIFFHFSGFDPSTPSRLSKHTERYTSGMDGALGRIVADYAGKLVANGFGKVPSATYAYGNFVSGTPVPGVVRRMFRDWYPTWPGDPFANFEEHLHRPWLGADMLTEIGVVTNLMAYLHQTSSYLTAYSDLKSKEGQSLLLDWFLKHAARELRLDERIIYPAGLRHGAEFPPPARRSRIHDAEADISVVGYLRTTSGVGEVGRANLLALSGAGLHADGFDVGLGVIADRSDSSVDHLLTIAPRGRVRLFNINADQLPLVMPHVGAGLDAPCYTIAAPFWELADFPDAWLPAFDAVDEVWAPSGFIQLALTRKLNKPVLHMPVPLAQPSVKPMRRPDFGLPEDRFLFLFAFDFLSFVERKNPLGVIEAFRRAFPEPGGGARPALVIKILNAAHVPEAARGLDDAIKADPDIFVVDQVLLRSEIAALVSLCDAVVSLHRSEGFGLLVAEAMLLERPVIATDYASTTELVSPATGFPVDFRLVPVAPGAYPFGHGQVWADPDLDHAAWLMARLRSDPSLGRCRSRAAREHVKQTYSPMRVGQLQRDRLRELGLVR